MAAAPNGPDRSNDLEWCRAFIDHHCILRSPSGQPILTNGFGLSAWQFYLPVATLDGEFMRRIGRLFWDQFADNFRRQPFQLCGCESGGLTVACALQAVGYELGFAVNVIEAKKAAKTYGLRNWLEGVILELPVMLVDDVIGSKKTLTAQAKRLVEFGLALYSPAFCIASCKTKPPLTIDDLGISIRALFGPDDFTVSHTGYVAKYRKPPRFEGSLR